MTADITLIPSLVDNVIMGPTPGLRYLLPSELCIDPDPEITAILTEPTPVYGPADAMIDEGTEG